MGMTVIAKCDARESIDELREMLLERLRKEHPIVPLMPVTTGLFIRETPDEDSVPLYLLCRWLATKYDPPCVFEDLQELTLINIDDRTELWRRAIKRWMTDKT